MPCEWNTSLSLSHTHALTHTHTLVHMHMHAHTHTHALSHSISFAWTWCFSLVFALMEKEVFFKKLFSSLSLLGCRSQMSLRRSSRKSFLSNLPVPPTGPIPAFVTQNLVTFFLPLVCFGFFPPPPPHELEPEPERGRRVAEVATNLWIASTGGEWATYCTLFSPFLGSFHSTFAPGPTGYFFIKLC